MKSLDSRRAPARRAWRYLAACYLTGLVLACASDDSDESGQGDMASAEQTSPDASVNTSDRSKSSDSGSRNAGGSNASSTIEDDNAGAAAVMRYDGTWQGKTSQGRPISFKILNRFLAHLELGYEATDADADAGACDDSEGKAALSAMLPMRGTGFMLMKETDAFSLEVTAMFPSDSSAKGEFTIQEKGGCQAEASGTWEASKP